MPVEFIICINQTHKIIKPKLNVPLSNTIIAAKNVFFLISHKKTIRTIHRYAIIQDYSYLQSSNTTV